jgi:hypothetical protein
LRPAKQTAEFLLYSLCGINFPEEAAMDKAQRDGPGGFPAATAMSGAARRDSGRDEG